MNVLFGYGSLSLERVTTPAESISHSDSTPPREIEQTASATSPPVKVYCVASSVLVYALFQIIHII